MYKLPRNQVKRIYRGFLSPTVMVLYTKELNKTHKKQTYKIFCTFNPENQAL